MSHKPYNFQKILSVLRLSMHAENLSSSTTSNYLSDIRYFLGWLTGEYLKLRYSEIIPVLTDDLLFKVISSDPQEIFSQYLSHMQHNGYSQATVNRRVNSIRKCFIYFSKLGLIKPSITSILLKEKYNQTEVYSTKSAEYAALYVEDQFAHQTVQVKQRISDDIHEFLKSI